MRNHSTEQWKDIPNFEGIYQCSNHGRVRSLDRMVSDKSSYWGTTVRKRFYKGRLLPLRSYLKYGHIVVTLKKGRKGKEQWLVHRLVLTVFVGPCPEGMECRHLNGNPANNRLENLRWGTSQENKQDMLRHGTHVCNFKPKRGESNGGAKLTKEEVLLIRKLYETGEYSRPKLGRLFNVSTTLILKIVRRLIWTHI